MPLKYITRDEIKAQLLKWSRNEISTEDIFDWANKVYLPGEVNFDDLEDGDSVANEILLDLDNLGMNLITQEDIPIYLRFLATPRGEFKRGYKEFRQALRKIDFKERIAYLRKHPFYQRYCGENRPMNINNNQKSLVVAVVSVIIAGVIGSLIAQRGFEKFNFIAVLVLVTALVFVFWLFVHSPLGQWPNKWLMKNYNEMVESTKFEKKKEL